MPVSAFVNLVTADLSPKHLTTSTTLPIKKDGPQIFNGFC